MKPHAYTHRESGENFLIGVALLEAWERRDVRALEVLIGTDPSDMRAAVIGVCRAAHSVAHCLAGDQQAIDNALRFARSYGQMRRDDLGGDDELNRSNLKG